MSTSVKRILKVTGLVLVSLILILYFFAVDDFLEYMVKQRLHSYINNTPDRLYDISYETLDISLADRAVRAGKISVLPRKQAIDSMRNDHLSMLMSVEVDSFYFDGLGLFKLLVLNKLEINEVVASRPVVKYYFNREAKTPPQEGKVVDNVFSDKLKHAFLHRFKVDNGQYYAIRLPIEDSVYFRMDSSSLLIDEISIDPSQKNPFKMVVFDSLQFISGRFYGGFVENYRIDARSIEVSTKRKLLRIDSLVFRPKHFSMADTSVQFGHDIFMINTDAIEFKGLDFKEAKGNNDIYIRNININKPDFKVSTDKRLPKNMDRKPLFGEMLRKINVPFGVDTLEITDGRVLYHETVGGQKPPLNMLFTEVDLMGVNITNDSILLSENPEMKLNIRAKFLDAGDLSLYVEVPVLSEKDKMKVRAKLGPMSFKPVSEMLEGPLQVRFLSGKINSMETEFIADTKHSSGHLYLDYSDMKIQIFKEKMTTQGEKEKEKWFLNAIVNTVVKTNNHKDDINFASGLIEYDRPEDIGVPGYVFQSLKEGLLTTMMPEKRHADEAKEKKKEISEEKKEQKQVEKEEQAEEKVSEKEKKKEKRKSEKKAKKK